ncbi:MAG: nitrile hydratase subunit alpha [Deltaproteobacteria bacterium]|nr:nitrile hydratase subunit alpha [Deltaproteobacteria bacterium]
MAKTADEAKSHMQDYEAHVRAVEEDLEYYRTKRFEPRIFYSARRGLVTLYDILKAKSSIESTRKLSGGGDGRGRDLVTRIRAVEDGLDDYVKGIGLISSSSVKGLDMVIEDTRKERGDYDEFFRIAKKEHHGDLEERLERLEGDLRDYQMLLDAFTHALIQKGLASEDELNKRREALRTPDVWTGARIVARCWVDPGFKARLIEKGREVVRELGIAPGRLGKLGVVENTESVHNVVVCTLCSCYPHDLLGDTPWWYKHDIYKKRIIADPRGTLEEMFGLKISSSIEVRVHDSTSDVRYMVLPRRPSGTHGMKEEELAKLVTVDSLIGAGEPLHPSRLAEAKEFQQVRPAP